MDAKIFGIGFYSPDEHILEYQLAVSDNIIYEPYTRNTREKDHYPVWCIENALSENKGVVFVNNAEVDFKEFGFNAPPKDGNRKLEDGSQSPKDPPMSLIYVPLVFQRTVLGVITVQSQNKNAYKTEDKDFLEDLARIVSIASANARTYEDVYQSNLKKDLIVAVADHDTHKFFGWAKASIKAIEDKSNTPETKQHIKSLKDFFSGIENTFKNLKKWSSQLKIERFEPKMTKLDLLKFAKSLHLYEGYAAARNLDFKLYKPTGNIFIKSDKTLLEILFDQLISNSLKYTKKGAIIVDIKLNDSKNLAIITIQDTGIGIPKDYIPEIFNVSFDHSKINPTAEGKGTGTGLRLCKEIIKKHNGEISFAANINEGTKVIFKIPTYI